MPKTLKGISNRKNYSLLTKWSSAVSPNVYDAKDFLEGWWQFNQDISSSGVIDDLSGNQRFLGQPSTGNANDRPLAPTSDSPSSGYYRAPTGFPTKSAEFSNDNIDTSGTGSTSHFQFHANGQDLPFSFSAWFKFHTLGTHQVLAGKYRTTSNSREWVVLWDQANQRFAVNLSDGGTATASTMHRIYSNSNKVTANEWTHIAVTYDGRGGTLGPRGVRIYVNGKDETNIANSNFASSYSSMGHSNAQAIFTVGNFDTATEDPDYDFDGQFAECAIWSTALSPSAARALYTVREEGVRNTEVSGIVSSPVRIQLRDQDRTGGHYPSKITSGYSDSSRTKKFPFDDTKTVNYVSSFASAQIIIDDPVQVGEFFELTGSGGITKKRFRFVYNADHPEIGPGESNVIPIGLFRTDVDGSSGFKNDPESVSKYVVRAINSQVSNLGIDAKLVSVSVDKYDSEGNLREDPIKKFEVRLNHRIPGVGTFSDGNTITVGTIVSSEEPNIRATQFKLGTRKPVNFPERTHPGSSENVATGHLSTRMPVSSSLVPGISDQNHIPVQESRFKPFDESRVSVDNQSPFDATGTDLSILPGFTNPTKSKTQIVLDLTSADPTGDAIFFSTGSPGPAGTYVGGGKITGKKGSGFSYWNSTLKRWEMLKTEGDPYSHTPNPRVESCLGFSLIPSSSVLGTPRLFFQENGNEHNRKLAQLSRNFGIPVQTYGFPFATQYNATSSQEIDMSMHISSPFLLEKMHVEIEGVFGLGENTNVHISDLPITKNIFILNQTTRGDNPHVVNVTRTVKSEVQGTTTPTVKTALFKDHTQNGHREIVSWGKLGFLRSDNLVLSSSKALKKYKEDYEVLKTVPGGSLASNPFVTSSFHFNLVPKLALSQDLVSVHSYRNAGSHVSLKEVKTSNPLGGADLLGNASGRQLASSLGASVNASTGSFSSFKSLGDLSPQSETFKISPYLLMPTDRLIVGWQNLSNIRVASYANHLNQPAKGATEQVLADQQVDQIKRVKITLFGSLIRNNREYHDTLNQSLTTKEIHEVILGEPVVDQYDVETIQNLSGSTFDSIFFGDIKKGTNGSRGRLASIAKGEAGHTGSLSRNIGFSNDKNSYQDSLTAPLDFLLSLPLFFPLIGSLANPGLNSRVATSATAVSRNSLVLSNNPISSSFKLLMHQGFHNSNAFLGRKTFSPASNYLETPGGGLVTSAKFLAFDVSKSGTAKYNIFSGTLEHVNGVKSFGSPEISKTPALAPAGLLSKVAGIKQAISSLIYAAPRQLPGRISWSIEKTSKDPVSVVPAISGFRHGFINSRPVSPVTYFRRDHYGYFRDLIEQGPETATVGLFDIDMNDTIEGWDMNDGPVKVRFFSRTGTPEIDPLDTNTQNLSTFATSSLPYFDGLNMERDVKNDPPPDMTDRTTSEEAVGVIIDGDASS